MGEEGHTRNLLAWYSQVVADRDLTLLAFHVAHVIGQHVNRETGDAWPAQARICEALSASRRGVQQTIDQLVARGHLSVTVQRGRNGSNRYRPILINAHRDAHPGEDNARTRAHPERDNAHADAHLAANNAHRDAHPDTDNARGDAHPLRAGTRTNLLIEPSERESLFRSDEIPIAAEPIEADAAAVSRPAKARRANSVAPPRDFSRWWAIYPRKVGKDAARQVFDRIIKSGRATLDQLIEGVERYAAERAEADPEFTKHPKTWLSGGHWADEPAPRSRSDGGSRGFSATDRFYGPGAPADE